MNLFMNWENKTPCVVFEGTQTKISRSENVELYISA